MKQDIGKIQHKVKDHAREDAAAVFKVDPIHQHRCGYHAEEKVNDVDPMSRPQCVMIVPADEEQWGMPHCPEQAKEEGRADEISIGPEAVDSISSPAKFFKDWGER